MFTTEEDFYFGYPPPHPPSKTKAHILRDVDFTEVDKRAKSVSIHHYFKCSTPIFLKPNCYERIKMKSYKIN